jgi:hypothetical protein
VKYSPVDVPLSCGHIMRYSPEPTEGDFVYCASCASWNEVVSGKPGVTTIKIYRATCTECVYVRKVTDQETAELRAQTHSLARRHTVSVIHPDGYRLVTYGDDTTVTNP